MTYQTAINILSSGNTLWNKWRREYPDVEAFKPDLHNVDLRKAHLSEIDFHEADLTEANLQGADLHGADLREADLRHANLRGSDLSNALLQKAHLRGADLTGAKLCHANFQGADLTHADLRGTDLLDVSWTKALFEETQFDEASAFTKNLNKVNHDIPLETPEQILAKAALHAAAIAAA